MLKIKCNILIFLLSTLLVGSSTYNSELTSQNNTMSLVELCDFTSNFVEKVYAPKNQEDIDKAVGDGIEIIDTTAMFHFLIKLPKEIDKESYVNILNVSYGTSDGAEDLTSNLIVRFELYANNKLTNKYVRFDFNDEYIITSIAEHYVIT